MVGNFVPHQQVGLFILGQFLILVADQQDAPTTGFEQLGETQRHIECESFFAQAQFQILRSRIDPAVARINHDHPRTRRRQISGQIGGPTQGSDNLNEIQFAHPERVFFKQDRSSEKNPEAIKKEIPLIALKNKAAAARIAQRLDY